MASEIKDMHLIARDKNGHDYCNNNRDSMENRII